ncbi:MULTISPECIES: hypothetical protein [Vibrio]|uniref:hypothetical protein n=1 Tax=Vibrio TaxID=662 RepID=UPI002075973B|nr:MULTISPECIES: hypothetical protein [Vibrio]USD33769.1 hypothetical protein J8Z27_06655 [Vibrio sp. SCSIO 43186]USD46838.1 hypothetical protein J4N38_06850 [Vibrio sp. SCSIO 43145]USD46869.1 hypothetical protein J4N38_07040 [Vibrio sp. SCSIO 43145]USD70894.1 hypothetical protein J4N41_06660 [Vibrio sp. SCSIO 43139]USD95802.1 hypothetical protein CTT30_06770 [Vibrio coralliilyticus]
MKKAIVIASTIVLSACSSTYVEKGIDLNTTNGYATITTQTEKNNKIFSNLDQRLVITKHNDKSLLGLIDPYPDVLHVKEGMQSLSVQYTHLNQYANGCLWIDAKAGENYIIKREVKNYSVGFWVENTKTQEMVGGICGSEPNRQTK